MPVISREEVTKMKQVSSFILYSGMEDNMNTLADLLEEIEILAKNLNAESSDFDVEKVRNYMSTIQTYISLMDAAGQILKNRKGIREPTDLVVPNNMLVAENTVHWIDERLTVNKTREAEILTLIR